MAQQQKNIDKGTLKWSWPIPAAFYSYMSDIFHPGTHAGCRGGSNIHTDGHYGIDIAGGAGALKDKPIVPIADGVVKYSGWTNKRGHLVIVEHYIADQARYVYSQYQHMRDGCVLKNGTKVVRGSTVLGYVGDSGSKGSFHLHLGMFTVYRTDKPQESDHNGSAIDPAKFVSADGAPHETPEAVGQNLAAQEAYENGGFYANGGFGNLSSNYDDETGNTETSIQHQTETIRAWTHYNDDNKRKGVDDYKLVWKGYQQKAYDISGRIADLSLKDSIESFCQELSFTLVRSDIDYYLQQLDDFQVGDSISLMNTTSGEVIFVGTVQQTSGTYGEPVSVTCLDKGMALTKNEFLMQFQSCTAYDALSTIAHKCGLDKMQSPKFTSSNEQTYQQSASEIISDILGTIKTENGITYFCRVIDDTLVVRSRGKDYITPYYKPSENVEAFPCVMAASKISYQTSTANTYNSVKVYQSEDSSHQVVGEKEDAESIERFGRWEKLVEYSGKDPATGPKKAEYELDYVYNIIEKTISFSCPGSDRIIAGVRIQVPLKDEVVECWVQSVTHTYYPNHIVQLDLKICDNEEPVYEGPDVEESVDDEDGTESGTGSSGIYGASDAETESSGYDDDKAFEKALSEQKEKAHQEALEFGGSDPTL